MKHIEEVYELLQDEKRGNGRATQQIIQARMVVRSSEDRKHTSGGLFVAVDSNLGAPIGKEEGTFTTFPSNEARIDKAWGECQRRYAGLCRLLMHSEGWTPRNEALMEAVVKQARTARHPRLLACVANMNPEDFQEELMAQRQVHVR